MVRIARIGPGDTDRCKLTKIGKISWFDHNRLVARAITPIAVRWHCSHEYQLDLCRNLLSRTREGGCKAAQLMRDSFIGAPDVGLILESLSSTHRDL
jgi:hypothetical protein